MSYMLEKVEEKLQLVKLNCSNRECPQENKDLEAEFKCFLEQGISNVVREGELPKLYTPVQARH